MRCVLTLALLAVAAGPVWAETYKWVDDKGRTHYSNNPPPSAKAKQVSQVEDRISTYQTDPAYEQYLRRRAEQISATQEAEWQARQRYLVAAQAAAPPDYHQANLSSYPDYYYPAYYAPGYVVGARNNHRPRVMHHGRTHVSSGPSRGFSRGGRR